VSVSCSAELLSREDLGGSVQLGGGNKSNGASDSGGSAARPNALTPRRRNSSQTPRTSSVKSLFGTAAEMLRTFDMRMHEARKLVAVSDGRRVYGKRFTQCAKLFIRGEFAQCLEVMDVLQSDVVASASLPDRSVNASGGLASAHVFEPSASAGAADIPQVLPSPRDDTSLSSLAGLPGFHSPQTPQLNGIFAPSAASSPLNDAGLGLTEGAVAATIGGGDIPACSWIRAFGNGGPMVNDLAFEMIYKLCQRYVEQPPDAWFGDIQAETK
jgi:hypothetical protein